MTAESYDERHKLKDGDLLFARSGATVGKTYLHSESIGEAIFAGYCIRFRFDTEKVLPQYIYDYTKSNRYQTWVKSIQRAAGQPNINKEEYKSFTIPLPSIEKQKELVAEMDQARQARRAKLAEAETLLSSLDDWLLIQLGITAPPEDNHKTFAVRVKSINKRLDVHANQSRFQKLFKELQSLPFEVLPLSQLTTDIFSGITPRAGGEAYVEPPNGVSFVRSGEIGKDGIVTPTHEIYISNETHEKTMKRSQLKQNDVLIAIVGATIGNVGVYISNEKANINQAIASVRLNDSILPKYLVCYLKSKIGQQILDYLKRPVARANINLEEIGNILVPVLDKDFQERIISEFDSRFNEKMRLRTEAENLWQAAKDKFEAQLLTGE